MTSNLSHAQVHGVCRHMDTPALRRTLYVLLMCVAFSEVIGRPLPSNIARHVAQTDTTATGQHVQASFSSSTDGSHTTFTLLVAYGGSGRITNLRMLLDRHSLHMRDLGMSSFRTNSGVVGQQGGTTGSWRWLPNQSVQAFQLLAANLQSSEAPLLLSSIAQQAVSQSNAFGTVIWKQPPRSAGQPGTTVLVVSYENAADEMVLLEDEK